MDKSENIWRVRAASRLVDASKEVGTEECRAVLLLLVRKTGDEGKYELAVQSNGGDDITPETMAEILRSMADELVPNARELTETIQ